MLKRRRQTNGNCLQRHMHMLVSSRGRVTSEVSSLTLTQRAISSRGRVTSEVSNFDTTGRKQRRKSDLRSV